MHIAFDAKRFFLNFTGLGNYSRTTIDILRESNDEDEYWLLSPRIKECAETNPFLRDSHCHTIRLSGAFDRSFGIASHLKKNGIGIYHGLSNELPVGLKRNGIRSIVTIHDVAFRTYPDMYHWIDRQIYDLKWRYACQHADHIIVISESTKRDVMKFYGVEESRISVIYQPVQKLFYSPIPLQEARVLAEKNVENLPQDYLLYVGSINSRKNLLGIVKAVEKLPKDVQIPLVVVGGSTPYKQEVLQYISEHHLEKLIIFPQRIADNRSLQALYTSARAFIYPSFYEGFGLPVVEALLQRCPVVTSNVSSLPEAGGKGALLANPYDYMDICHCIEKLLIDSKTHRRLSTEGYQYARTLFNRTEIAQQLRTLYQQQL
jgi:glycosyltransferase involved in cell wall biosynthesis